MGLLLKLLACLRGDMMGVGCCSLVFNDGVEAAWYPLVIMPQ
jgi:hypothetical protein